MGLTDFYRLRSRSRDNKALPQTHSRNKFTFLDDEKFQSSYVELLSSTSARIGFYLEGIHCAACVWLLEKLPIIAEGVRRAQVDLGSGSLTVEFDPSQIKLSRIASTIQSLGYQPHPLEDYSGEKTFRSYDRDSLLRIGVAGVAVSNTMLYATSLYQGWLTGMETRFVQYFNIASFILCVPAVFYSAVPLYQRALAGLRNRTLHIDLPLSVAIVSAFIVSSFHTLRGSGEVYFDTISMLIFLLLVARYIQYRSLQAAQRASRIEAALLPLSTNRLRRENGAVSEEEVYIGALRPGDEIHIRPGERVPVDGQVVSGHSSVHEAILTGEPNPINVLPGSKVIGGAVNLESPIIVKATSNVRDGQAGRLLELLRQSSRQNAKITAITDRTSGYFVFCVILLALATAGFWGFHSGATAALNNTLALLVITCPCALGLAAPINFSLAARRALAEGILIKGTETIEQLDATRNLFLDKTGTLTFGCPILKRLWHDKLTSPSTRASDRGYPPLYAAVLAALEQLSRHPLGKELLRFADTAPAPCTEIAQIAGGVSCRLGDDHWIVGSQQAMAENQISIPSLPLKELSTEATSHVFLARNSVCVSIFALQDSVRPEMKHFVDQCKKKGIVPKIISGDNIAAVSAVANELGISDFYANLLPEEKWRMVEHSRATERGATVMVGDGANDAPALRSAHVGVGVSGGAELCLQLADVYLTSPSARTFDQLFSGCRQTMQTIRITLGFSVAYNIIGAAAAIGGFVTPLVAAVVMPISSLIVVLVALWRVNFSLSK